MVDDLGRNLTAILDNESYIFLDIRKYKIEEKIFDWQKQKRITYNQFIKDYFFDFNLKSVFTLNNKICVQVNEDVSVFSLKDDSESKRLLSVLEDTFIEQSRNDCIFVSDVSSAQRKWIYNIMSSKGFNKKRLYRTKTTFSKR